MGWFKIKARTNLGPQNYMYLSAPVLFRIRRKSFAVICHITLSVATSYRGKSSEKMVQCNISFRQGQTGKKTQVIVCPAALETSHKDQTTQEELCLLFEQKSEFCPKFRNSGSTFFRGEGHLNVT